MGSCLHSSHEPEGGTEQDFSTLIGRFRLWSLLIESFSYTRPTNTFKEKTKSHFYSAQHIVSAQEMLIKEMNVWSSLRQLSQAFPTVRSRVCFMDSKLAIILPHQILHPHVLSFDPLSVRTSDIFSFYLPHGVYSYFSPFVL